MGRRQQGAGWGRATPGFSYVVQISPPPSCKKLYSAIFRSFMSLCYFLVFFSLLLSPVNFSADALDSGV